MFPFSTPAEKFLRDMVAIPSVTGSEGLMKDYLAKVFGEMGLDVELQHVDGDRYNVIGKMGDGPVRLMLCTHTDVIPALDEALWRTPPFEATAEGGRIYGRGTTDAKGSLAAAMEALQRAKKSLKEAKGAVALAAVVEEETGRSVGARKLMEVYRPEAGIILEPTGLRVATAHKGALRPVITVHGRAAHSSVPGVNAVSIAGKVLRGLELYRDEVMKADDPLLGHASLEVTMIHGGERINVIPQKCLVYVDRRLMPGETVDGAYGELIRVVERIGAEAGARVDVKLLCSYPSTSVDEGEHIVTVIKNVLAAHGLPPAPVGFPAGCDMWAFRKNNIPTAILGPGHIGQAHGADEYIEREQLRLAAGLYEEIIASVLSPS